MIRDYINYIRNIQGYSEHTCEAYERDLSAFARWAQAHLANARWSSISEHDIEQYICYLSKQGYKPTSTNRALTAIKAIYRYWVRKGLITISPAKGVMPRLEDKPLPKTTSEDSIIAAYNASTGDSRIIIALLYVTGIRLGELLGMTWNDVNFLTGTIRIHGKGRKEREVYAPKGILYQLEEKSNNGSTDTKIFTYTPREVRRMIETAFSNIADGVSPHVLRHTAATHWAMNGASNTTIAKALGHSRIETSQKYINMAQIDVKPMMANNYMFH